MPYAAGIPVDIAKHRGHPLKSFSIPAPPSNTPMIPGQKQGKNFTVFSSKLFTNFSRFPTVPSVQVIRPQNSSPYKKSAATTPSTSNRLQSGIAHSSDEVQIMLRPSTSTEELNQEMANLEGLMKDLSAITASEFEC